MIKVKRPIWPSTDRIPPGEIKTFLDIQGNVLRKFIDSLNVQLVDAYGSIWAHENSNATVISVAGEANKVQITIFDTNGDYLNCTPDHTNDHIKINIKGKYFVCVAASIESVAGAAQTFGFHVEKNNGATAFDNLHTERDLAGGGGDTGSITMAGIIDCAVDDTLEVWTWNDTDTNNIMVSDITMSVIRIGI